MTAAERVYAGTASLAFPLLLAGARALGVDREALEQRRGLVPDCTGPLLWVHGASAGEMAAGANLVALLRASGFRFAAAYTTTNDAGLRLIARRLAPGDVGSLVPWDAPRWVARAFDRWRPAALVLIETELWPAMILAAARRSVPVVCASARIYPRDVPRYRAIRALLRPTLERVATVLAQSEHERRRFISLGAPPEHCVVAGSLKHAAPPPAPGEVDALRCAIGLSAEERIWVAGSVHGDETEWLLAACEQSSGVGYRVVVAPRHLAEVPRFEAAAKRRGWAVARRSALPAAGGWRILLLDTMGELRAVYAAAAAAVVGGSFAAHGGHDLAEPIHCGTPVLFGPHTAHAEPEASALRAAEPSAAAVTPAVLAERIAAWMGDDALRRAVLRRQRAALPDPARVRERYAAAFARWCPDLRRVAART